MDYYQDRLSNSAPHWPPPYPHPFLHGQHPAVYNPYHPMLLPYIPQAPYPAAPPLYTQPASQDYNSLGFHYPEPDNPVLIHQPIPISAYSTLLPQVPETSSQDPSTPSPSQATPAAPDLTQEQSHDEQEEDASPEPAATTDIQGGTDQFVHAPQVMFPTPCDLLNDLAMRNRSSIPTSLPGSQPLAQSSPDGTAKLTKGRTASARKTKAPRPENQRKAYFRSVAHNVGFDPTDPDTITSHDKKRHYLECSEKYILWLHEQLRLVGKEPVALERVSSYRGLSSRSIRTLLVHMQDENQKLNEQIMEEEQEFMDLQEQIISRGVPVNIEMPDNTPHGIFLLPSGASMST
ncbi:hypothetical protein BXZ70DRAFT_784319 [Cristinia sonorae]|uniref:Uncharacterized protein n=1 Tax=Cristinia sonorae TaxID=1940300 RepID=A0A8K0URH2_9AGAR|nr:hypothetical protein BXZ70DRAFT_784319 [Cristinia sonorae]